MKLKELFDFFIEQGILKDPRGADAVRQRLNEEKTKFEKLSAEQKNDYDMEYLSNPYLDSRILYGAADLTIQNIFTGIDIETPELLLADTLRSHGKKIDLVVTHHPEGHAYATFYEVIGMQADIMCQNGVPINVAESIVDARRKEVARKVMPQNHMRAVDAAKLLNIPFMSTHTVADNQVSEFLQSLFESRAPKTLGDIIKLLKEIPEYREQEKIGVGPKILVGTSESRTGKILVEMTGGTEGPKESIEKLVNAGVGTVVGMHMSEDHYKEAQKQHLNVVLAGHISSDNLGMNILFDAAEKKFGPIDIISCSGFKRFKR